MNILLFGATGMVGDGVLRWLIASARVDRVVAVSRKALSVQHAKLQTVIESDMFRSQNLDALHGFDACFFCLGASSVGMSPEAYRRLTYDLTLAVARQLLPGNPRMVFEYNSGEGTDLNSQQRWARVKAETEAALLEMRFRDACALRPGFIQPMRGVRSRQRVLRWVVRSDGSVVSGSPEMVGRSVTSPDLLAEAMLRLAVKGNPKKILQTGDLNAVVTGDRYS